MTQSAEARHMDVSDAGRGERSGQVLEIELRVMARAWDGADVDEQLDSVRLQHRDEVLERAVRMADRHHSCFSFRVRARLVSKYARSSATMRSASARSAAA